MPDIFDQLGGTTAPTTPRRGGDIFDQLGDGTAQPTTNEPGFFQSIGQGIRDDLAALPGLPAEAARFALAGANPGMAANLARETAQDVVFAQEGDSVARKRLRSRQLLASTVAGSLIPGGGNLASRAALGAAGNVAAGTAERAVTGQETTPVQVATEAALGAVANPILQRVLGGRKLAGKVAKAVEPETPMSGPVQRVVAALNEAPPAQRTQRTMQRMERGRRMGEAEKATAGLKGEAALKATLSQMKGELPKVDFSSLRGKVSDDDITALIEQARSHPGLGWWERQIHAPLALQKLFDGKLPTKGETQLLDTIFGPDLTKALLAKRSGLQKAKDLGIEILNLPREIMSSYDLSAPLRQGAFLIGRPKQFGNAFVRMFRYFGDARALKALEDDITSRPTFDLMRKSGLSITQAGSALLGQREEPFVGGLARRIPIIGVGVRASERAYTGFLNKLRADVFDDLVHKAEKQGIDPEDVGAPLAKFINAATGRGNLPKALEASAPALSAALFSPRLMASRIQLLNPVYYLKALQPGADPAEKFARKEAIKSLLTAGSMATSVLGLAKLAGADVETDPSENDFGKIKVGNTRFDMLAGFGQYIRLGARLATQDGKVGEIGRFLRYKEAPVFAMAHNILAGQNALGEDVTIPGEAKRSLLPLVVQDIKDAVEEWGPAGAATAIPAAFGIGVQTYE